MSDDENSLPPELPEFLRHTDADAPVPTWDQMTASTAGRDEEMIAHVVRIIAVGDGEQATRAAWENWPASSKRSLALLLSKIRHEGWIDAVGPIVGNAWDGGFFFSPRASAGGGLADILDARSADHGGYIRCELRSGLFAYLNAAGHSGWVRAWMETDTETAALHVGMFKDGTAEVHLDVFNPLFIDGASRGDVIRLPLLGAVNHKQFWLHNRWERSSYAKYTRRSANYYYLMVGKVPIGF